MVGFTALWLVLTGGDLKAPLLALVVVLAAAAVSVALAPPGAYRIRPLGTLRFLSYFLAVSARAGFDVARLALLPGRLPLPGEIELELALPEGAPRTFFALVAGLVPGTLARRIDGARVIVHVLDQRTDPLPQLRRLERRVADLYGLDPRP